MASAAQPIADIRLLLAAGRVQAQRIDIPVRGMTLTIGGRRIGHRMPVGTAMPSILPADVFDAASLGLFEPSLPKNVHSLS